MADIHKFSERVIDVAERTSAVADAAQGKTVRRGVMPARWLLLPAAGAGLYALDDESLIHAPSKERHESGEGTSL